MNIFLRFTPILLGCMAYGQADVRGSSDHPLFPKRMPGYRISHYQQQGFAAFRFRTKPPTVIEGRYTKIHYYLENLKEHPGGLGIVRNYENAVKAVGGEVVLSTPGFSVMKAKRGETEVWAEVQASAGRIYFLHIVEREALQQVITADAMAAAIDKDGFIALDIRFATAKSDILPESKAAVAEIATMLQKRPSLKVGIEGHTDNTGNAAGNKALSEQRAKSVVAALVAAGIDASRMTPAGFGQERPIGDNRTEEGRAKNRRVEVVKK